MEPEKPVEKALRECAEQRRREAGDPLELHPATRRLLQGEVARRYLRPPATAQPPLRKLALWPRLAWAFGLVAFITVLTIVLIPGSHRSNETTSLARLDDNKVETFKRAEPAAAPAPTAAAPAGERDAQPIAAAPQTEKETSRLLKSQERRAEIAAESPVERARQLSAPLPAQSSVDEETQQKNRGVNLPRSQAAAASDSVPTRSYGLPADSSARNSAAPRVAPPEATGLAGAVTSTNATLGALGNANDRVSRSLETAQNEKPGVEAQRYKRIPKDSATDNFAHESPGSVLTSFQITVAGGAVQIRDADGSVYEGALSAAEWSGGASPGAVAESSAKREALADADQKLARQPVSFRVSGTNRTLKARVVFAGTFGSGTNTPGLLEMRRATKTPTGGRAVPGPWILGKAVVEGGQEIEIQAAPE